MKKLTTSQIKEYSANLRYIMSQASNDEIDAGKSWYLAANEFCRENAIRYNTTPEIVAAIVSALSPRNKWSKNLLDTITVLDAVNSGCEPEDVKVSTFHSNKRKAFSIARGEKEITWESQKTYSFVRNIACLDAEYVTVDVWHLRACMMEKVPSTSIGKIAYVQMSELTKKVAAEYGLSGFELQAVCWVTIQRLLK